MDYLRNSILATIVYYDAFDFPLTPVDVFNFLVNPERFSRLSIKTEEYSLNQILEELDRLEKSKILGQKNGFFFIYGRDSLYDLRIYRQKIADQKWKKFLRSARWLRFAPYLEGFFVCGSMALGNTTPKSDFDVFIIAKSGRLYTNRLFLWLIASLLGDRRKPSDKTAPDKFCFNHYITDGSNPLKYRSIYTAQLYSSLKPAYMPDEVFNNFFKKNSWIKEYLLNFKPHNNFVRRNLKRSRFADVITGFIELILNSSFGDFVEDISKEYQQNKIKNNPLTGQPGGRVVCNDDELEFHPFSFEGTVIKKYNDGLTRLGVVPFIAETDSGLTG